MSTQRQGTPTKATLEELYRLSREGESYAAFESVAIACGLTPEEADALWQDVPPETVSALEGPDFVIAQAETANTWLSMPAEHTEVPER